jgi:hypothetical protein
VTIYQLNRLHGRDSAINILGVQYGVLRFTTRDVTTTSSNTMTSESLAIAEPSVQPIEVSFSMPKAPEARIHLRLTIQTTSLLLFVTTTLNGDTSTTAPLGSFVYALPDVSCLSHHCNSIIPCNPRLTSSERLNAGQTLSTPLYTYESSIEFTTRLAKLLARKTAKPVYVGNSISFASAGMGGTVDEEMEGFKKVVEVVMDEVRKSSGGAQIVNGC